MDIVLDIVLVIVLDIFVDISLDPLGSSTRLLSLDTQSGLLLDSTRLLF
jgi:hypothetical protein